MKKIKIALISLFVCALGYSGYSAYDYVTMTEAERFLLANIEALAIDEPGGGGQIVHTAPCFQRFTVWNGESVRYTSEYVCIGGDRRCTTQMPMLLGGREGQGTCYFQ